ncbi:MAG: MarR family transcriptional regulator [Candidatus Lokiarchaeota archaeon]|nr:MarR family transcriptional regulator [Candidatus Lokiarchaeota archaeon]
MVDNRTLLAKEFFQFLETMRDLLVASQPGLAQLINSKEFPLDKDPFGRYFQVILHIGNNERCSMTEFADYFDLKPATATGMIDRLVQLELVQRESNPNDRRKVEIKLSESGIAIYEQAHSFLENEVKKIIDQLTEEEIQFLIKISKKINAKLAD